MWNKKAKSHNVLLERNKLSKKATSLNIRHTTPLCVIGAGVVGIFKGAGVFQY
jgi:hypothetical protein